MFKLKGYNKSILPWLLCLFVLFECSLLGLNIWLSLRLEQDALEINVAGRQRMLVQSMIKNIYLLAESNPGETKRAHSIAITGNILRDAELFAATLSAFHHGGETVDPAGKRVIIRAVGLREQRNTIAHAKNIWQPFEREILAALSADKITSTLQFKQLISLTKACDEVLLAAMNNLTILLADQSRLNARKIRNLQMIAFTLASLNFVIIIRKLSHGLSVSASNTRTLRTIINNIDANVVIAKDKSVIDCNGFAESLFSRSRSQLIGTDVTELLNYRHNNQDAYVILEQDKTRYLTIASRDISIDGTDYAIYTLIDVTQQKSQEDHLEELAFVDSLTQLGNRLTIEGCLQQEVSRANRNGSQLSVLFIDLDGFKKVNDTFGHQQGDSLLREVAKILKSRCRSTDILGRIGGDEFLVICPETKYEDASLLADDLIQHISDVSALNSATIDLGASIGISTFPGDALDAEALWQQADMAMYRAKQNGKNRHCHAFQLAGTSG